MSNRIAFYFIGGLVTVVVDGNPFDVEPKHPKYKEIIDLLKRKVSTPQAEDIKAKQLLAALKADSLDLRAIAETIGWEDVKVDHGVVTVKGQPMRNSLTQRILDLQAAGLPYDSFVRFLVNLQANPSEESREALYDFLEQGRFPLTDDGCFLGYKGVHKGRLTRPDGTEYKTLVDCHSGKFDMAPGNRHSMPRDKVDDNRNSACGAGFHVGTIGHAKGFGGVMIVVKVNPRDVVSVPRHDRTKLRCCEYESVNIFTEKEKAEEFQAPSYTKQQYTSPALFEKKEVIAPKTDYSAMKRDKLARLAAERGITQSVNEGRDLGKDTLVIALDTGALPLNDMSIEDLAFLAHRRHLFGTVKQARKAGRQKMIDALR